MLSLCVSVRNAASRPNAEFDTFKKEKKGKVNTSYQRLSSKASQMVFERYGKPQYDTEKKKVCVMTMGT